MPPTLLYHIDTAYTLPQHCEPSNSFLTVVSSFLHICLPTPLALVSSVLGTCSIISWLFAQLPQIYKNYQLQSTSGLSIYFLVEWCLGDSSNLVGALLTRQAGWQVVIAAYYVLVDVTLVFQYYWYTYYKNRQVVYGDVVHSHRDGGVLDGLSVTEESNSNSHTAAETTHQTAAPTQSRKSMISSLMSVSPAPMDSLANGPSPSHPNEKKYRRTRTSPSPPGGLAATRTILITSMLCAVLANASPTDASSQPPALHATTGTNVPELIGRIFSWLSTVLYLFSRPPQLYKNYTRKSTSGLSPLLFIAAFSGNFFYSASLLTNPFAWSSFPAYGGGGWADANGSDRLDWISRSIPFFLGAFCVLFMDGFMGVQFLKYGAHDEESIVRIDDYKDGVSRWLRVRGWMRGWIPSVSPSRIARGQSGRAARSSAPSPVSASDRERAALLGVDGEIENPRYGTV